MPDIESSDLWQTAVLWPWLGTDGYGKAIVGPPMELAPPNGVRWITKKREVLNPQGETIASDAQAMVDQVIVPRSLLRLGTLTDWNTVNPTNVDNGIHEVITYNETPDIRNRANRREVTLMKYRNQPPVANT